MQKLIHENASECMCHYLELISRGYDTCWISRKMVLLLRLDLKLAKS